ncbi:MAG: nuclear transport factor 2 family protein [Ilumatobacteraceae bacterium]
MDLQQLSDRAEIGDLVLQYSEALNRADWDTWRAVFTDDAHVDYTTAGGVAGSVDEAVAWLSPTFVMFDMRIGRIANVAVTLDTLSGDSATVSSQYTMTMRIPAADGGNPTYIDAAGWYDDIAVRTDAGWRLSARTERIAFIRM